MTVQELIDKLNEIEDKTATVKVSNGAIYVYIITPLDPIILNPQDESFEDTENPADN